MVNKGGAPMDGPRPEIRAGAARADSATQLETAESEKHIAEAEKTCRSLLALYPNHPGLLHNLAFIATQRRNNAEAESLLRRAIAAAPREPAFHNNLGNLLREKGNLVEAETCYRQALSLMPAYQEAYYNLGVVLEESGRFEDAVNTYRQALELNSSDAQTLIRISVILNRHNAFDDALIELDKAIRIQPDSYEAHYNRGINLSEIEQYDDAWLAFERAHALRPNSADALANLALISARKSDVAGARVYAARCFALNSEHYLATIALAIADLSENAFVEAERCLRLMLENSELSDNVRAFVSGLLGDALDGQNRCAEAFAAYKFENDQLLSSNAQRFAGRDRQTDYGCIVTYLKTAPPQDWEPPASTNRDDNGPASHIFLLGFMRSGTTLLENVLASHPDAVTLEERELFGKAPSLFLTSETGMRRLAALTNDDMRDYRDIYWRRIQALGIDVKDKMFVNKHPLNTLKLPLIYKLFPKAKVLLAVRDPRDIVLSCFRRHLGINVITHQLRTLENIAQLYDVAMRIYLCSRETMALDVHQHRYEDMIMDFDASVQAVCRFIGIEWNTEMRNFGDKAQARAIRSLSGPQVRRGIYREGIGQWRRYANELEPVLPALKPWVEKFGYPPN